MRQALLGATLLASLTARAEPAPEYRVGPGDVLRVQVYGEPDLSQDIPIPQTCRIQIPLIRALDPCQRTVEELGDQITARLAEGFLRDPIVMVDVAEYGSQKVEVIGAVETRGIQVLEGPTTLSQVITKAGGPAGDNVVYVTIERADGPDETYQISHLSRGPAVYVHAGDRVRLLHGAHISVLGHVNKPGEVPYREGMTVMNALAAAGDLGEFASTRRAFIRRADGEKVWVNLARIRDGLDADVVLEPGDTLNVRRAMF